MVRIKFRQVSLVVNNDNVPNQLELECDEHWINLT